MTSVSRPIPVVNGCHWCGVPQRDHAQRWHVDGRWHNWVAPTDQQRLERLRESNQMKQQVREPRVAGGSARPSRYGRAFDELTDRWALLEREHDAVHPDRDECGGVGGCAMMRRCVDLEHQLVDALVDWRVDHWGSVS